VSRMPVNTSVVAESCRARRRGELAAVLPRRLERGLDRQTYLCWWWWWWWWWWCAAAVLRQPRRRRADETELRAELAPHLAARPAALSRRRAGDADRPAVVARLSLVLDSSACDLASAGPALAPFVRAPARLDGLSMLLATCHGCQVREPRAARAFCACAGSRGAAYRSLGTCGRAGGHARHHVVAVGVLRRR
jgi:hypothetical protein